MTTIDASSSLVVPCNRCHGDTLHASCGKCRVTDRVVDKGVPIDFSETYSLLQCQTCGQARLQVILWNSENEHGAPQYFPPTSSRRPPDWLGQLESQYLSLMKEVYAAYDSGLRAITLMGVRAVLDVWVSSASSNKNDFKSKLERLAELGTLSALQVEILRSTFDAGSAAAHRGYMPNGTDVLTAIEALENLLHQEALLPRIASLQGNTPKRK